MEVVRDNEIKVLGEVNVKLESGSTEVDGQDDPLHETEDLFVGLDQPIQLVVSQINVHEGVVEEVIKMANNQAEALSSIWMMN
nr:hypothetical protein [Tanacetum cinerariifolium]